MPGATKSIWVLAEHADGTIQPVTYEVLAFADKVTRAIGGKISVVVLAHPARPVAGRIAEQTGFDVIGVDAEAARDYHGEAYRNLLAGLALSGPPSFLFIPHTTMGWDLAPGLAVDLGASSLSAVCGFEADSGPLFRRRILNGKILQDVRPIGDKPVVVTVVPGTENPYGPRTNGPGRIQICRKEAPRTRTRVLDCVDPPTSSVDLREAEVIITAGRGVGDAENLACIHELASLFKRGAVGASRPLCDMGLLPLTCQVGMTGQTVSPKLYIACGVSGAVQHTMGMKTSDIVVVINKDKNALFCGEAHYCVIADLHEFVPILINKILAFRGEPPDRQTLPCPP
jgi:electron transfer flavoprotein alpha subunit